jgi:hypothetical protein
MTGQTTNQRIKERKLFPHHFSNEGSCKKIQSSEVFSNFRSKVCGCEKIPESQLNNMSEYVSAEEYIRMHTKAIL